MRVVDRAQAQCDDKRRPPEARSRRWRIFSRSHAVIRRMKAVTKTSDPTAICSALSRFAVRSSGLTGTRSLTSL